MILTYVIYGLLAVYTLWGSKFYLKGFDENYLDKDSTKALSGLAAILVILHHISQKDSFQYVTQELSLFLDIGFLITSVFLFNSGYGLTVSYKNNQNYIKDFPRKRILAVFIPYFVSNAVFAIYQYIKGAPLSKALVGLTGLIAINPNGWFPVILIIMYSVFLFNKKHIKSISAQIAIYVFVVVLMFSIFCVSGHYAWWSLGNGQWLDPDTALGLNWWQDMQVLLLSGEWWVNSAIAFVVGVIYGEYKEKIVSFFKKGYWIKLIISIVIFYFAYNAYFKVFTNIGYWTEYAFMGPGIKDKFITAAAQFFIPVLFIIVLEILMMKLRINNKVLTFMGKISYETYLYGVLSLEGLGFIIYGNYGEAIVKSPNNYNLAIYAFGVIAWSILIGFIMNKVHGIIIKKICKK